MDTPILSKSKIINGLQCQRMLWLKTHHPEYAEKISTATQMQLNEGNEVGELARKLFGEGYLVKADYRDFQAAANETMLAIENSSLNQTLLTPTNTNTNTNTNTDKVGKDFQTITQVIYEASFLAVNLFARADILYKQNNEWHLIEVKKSTEAKNYQILDTAIQTFIIESSGLKLTSVSIMHINRNCEFPILDDFFKTVEITTEVRSLFSQFTDKLKSLTELSTQTIEPEVAIGPHCHNPFDCPFIKYCWKDVPKKSVFDLPMVPSKKKWELYNSGKKLIKDLDAKDFKGKSNKAIEVTQADQLWIETEAIKRELSQWQKPLYFFDFETVGLAIPRYRASKPYSAIPFQFSCHVWPADTDELCHFEYLHTENSDPRPGLIEAIVNNFNPTGSIVSYNKSFEITVIKQLAEYSPEHREKLLALVKRFVDPLPLFQNYVYHPDFLGSFSIKAVAPALIGEKLNYSNLAIGDGFAALAGAELILNDKISGEDKQTLIKNLLAYCQQDTLAMVEIVRWLIKNTGATF